tara:strand:+ start:5908 stop:7245 length:1338 start_codon:yes stop_codon:yes gene_type:complete
MPSNITPKDFENYLPKETDSIAASIVKFAQFSILFWRWFRSEFTSAGTIGKNIQYELCEEGCTDPEVVDEGGGDSNDNEEDNDNRNPDTGGGGGKNPMPPLPNLSCCKPDKRYGTNDEQDEFGNIINDKTFHFFESTAPVDLLCSDGNHKQVGIKPYRGGGHTFRSNEAWSKNVRIVRYSGAGGAGGTFDSSSAGSEFLVGGSQRPVFGNPGEGKVIRGTKTDLRDVEVVIYGRSPGFDINPNWDENSQIRGTFQINPGSLENEGSIVDFPIEPTGDWCVRLLVREWGLRKMNESDGFGGRGFEIKIHQQLMDRYVKKGTKTAQYWQPKQGGYLTKVEGIRMCNLENQAYKLHPSSVSGRNPTRVSDDGSEVSLNPLFCFYDERWQNEKPCFYPGVEHLAFTWSATEIHQVAQHNTVYKYNYVNDRIITSRSFEDNKYVSVIPVI